MRRRFLVIVALVLFISTMINPYYAYSQELVDIATMVNENDLAPVDSWTDANELTVINGTTEENDLTPVEGWTEANNLAPINYMTDEEGAQQSEEPLREVFATPTAYNNGEFLTDVIVKNEQGTPIEEGGVINRFDILKVQYHWALPDRQVKAGDTLTVALPEAFEFLNDYTTDLMHDGQVVGTAVLSKDDGTVTITFTDYAEKHDGVTMNFEAGMSINSFVLNSNGTVTVEFPSVETDFDFSFELTGEGTSHDELLTKYSWGYNQAEETINWTIRINLAKQNLTNVVVTDILNPGHELVPESISIYEKEFDFPEGALDPTQTFSQLLSPAEHERILTIADDNMSFVANFGDINTTTYVIDYKTKFTGINFIERERVGNTVYLDGTDLDEQEEGSYQYDWAGGGASGYERASAIVVKVDENGTPITSSPATFELYKADGTYLSSHQTDGNGLIGLNDLSAGDYYLIETQAPDGYSIVSGDKYEFKVGPGAVEKIIVQNTKIPQYGSVALVKVDAETNAALEGAVFDLVQNGTVIQSGLTTDANGTITVNNLTPGTYQFVETQAPNGYELDATPKVINVNTNETAEITVTNNQLMEVKGKKTWNDENNKDGKRPASITVKLLADGTEVASKDVTAADEWKYTFDNLPKTKDGQDIVYTVEEVKVEGYTTTYDGFNMTNSYTPEVTTVEGTKTWNDADNQDGKRPASITVNVLANGEQVASKEVTAADEWKYTFNNLPKYKDGQAIAYTVQEVAVDGYTTQYDGFNMTNSHTPEVTTVEGTKTWIDVNYEDKRPTSITVNLLADGEQVASKEVTAANEWTYTFDNLPKYKNGQEIVYTVQELNVEGYTTTYDCYNIINTIIIPETTAVEGTKTWDDVNNQDGKRPENITVNLLADGEQVDAQIVSADTNWQYAFQNLPKTKDGQDIVYTIEEISVEGYTTTYDGYNITNVYTPEKVAVEGTKIWNDENNQDGKRPENITVNLLADGEVVTSKEVTATDEWKYAFTDLPKFKNGVEINYTVTENAVADYTTEVNGFDITNTYTPGETSFTVTKQWNDADNQDGNRPTEVYVQLFANGNASGEPVAVTAEQNWTYTWTALQQKEAGNDIVYSVQEVNVPTGYTALVGEAVENNVTITNSYTPEVMNIEGMKTWIDVNNEDKRPASITVNLLADGEQVASKEVTAADEWTYTFDNLPKYKDGQEIVYTVQELNVEGYTTTYDCYNIINTIIIPETTAVEGTKTWDDANNQDGKRPTSITVNLLADGEQVDAQIVSADTNWKYVFANLPKTKDGQDIAYTVKEVAVEGYTPQYNGFDITNSYAPETVAVEGTKTWNDENYEDQRPTSITVNLLVGDEIVTSKEVTEADGWKYAFTDLPKFKDGQEVVYLLQEVAVEGYTTTYDGYNITNTVNIPETTTVEGTKTWDDANNQDGKRPENITVNLLADGTQVDTQTVSAETNWKYAFTNLPKEKDGQDIAYTVQEVAVDGYTTEYDGFNITNSYTPETVAVEGAKTWNDENYEDKRPASITVNLLADGEVVTSKEVTAADEWTYAFTSLPKYKDGKEIDYTVQEVAVEGYTTTYDGFNITNNFTPPVVPETVTVEGTKTWNDANNQDGKRPASITVNLLADDEVLTSKEVTAADEWKYTFDNLPKMKDGQAIAYTVQEVAVDGYTTEYDGFNMTNIYTPEVMNIEGTKIWVDVNNEDKRPASITVNLLANGEQVASKEVTAADEWKYTFTNLPKYKDGKEIVYTMEEVTVEGYTTTYAGYNITNTMIIPDTTAVEGTKTWNDANNQDGKRPTSITVNLLADGEQVDAQIVSADTNWKYVFANLPKTKDGQAIVYTVQEVAVDGYTPEYDGFNITNSYTPEVMNVEGTKTWVDVNNEDKRPASITVNLLADGEVVTSKEVTAADEWKYTFTNLPKYKDGKEISYTVTEQAVENYAAEVNGFDITNTYTAGQVTLLKVDADVPSLKLDGAVFQLKQGDRIIHDNLTTDANGQVTVNNLAPGEYQFVETAAPSGYVLDATPLNVTVKTGETVTVTKTNKQETTTEPPTKPGEVTLIKVDADNAATKLANAVFQLKQGTTVIQSNITTDINGQVTVSNLMPGEYQFVETAAPSGYVLDATPINVTVKTGETVTVTMTNKKQTPPPTPTGSVTLIKVDADNASTKLANAVFQLKQGTVLIQNNITTDANGQVTVSNLAPGEYQFVETAAPSGYVLDSTPIKVTVKTGETATITVTNKKQTPPPTPTGSVTLIKVDADNASTKLANAVFQLKQGAALIQSNLKTDANGQVTVSNLAPGEYQFVETAAPSGYVLDSTPIKVTVKTGETATITVTNKKQTPPPTPTGSVTLIKVDADNASTKLANAVFQLKQGSTVIQSNLTTNANGQLTVNNLAPGEYQFVETAAPSGYVLDTTPLNVTVKTGETVTVTMENTKQTPPPTPTVQVETTKVDGTTNAPLAGATFQLYKQNSAGVFESVPNAIFVTGANGKVNLGALAVGKYRLEETIAPAGYVKLTSPVSFEVTSADLNRAGNKLELTAIKNYKTANVENPPGTNTGPSTETTRPPTTGTTTNTGTTTRPSTTTPGTTTATTTRPSTTTPSTTYTPSTVVAANPTKVLPQTSGGNTLWTSMFGTLLIAAAGMIFFARRRRAE